jgi:hypothetical protein
LPEQLLRDPQAPAKAHWVLVLQPQPLAPRHTGPGLQLLVQSAHRPPELPQSSSRVPTRQVPFSDEQQPPLHIVSPAAPHALVHCFVPLSQA